MKRHHVVWLLSFFFIIGVCIQILHFPFRRSAVMRVIPRSAVMVSRHIAPAERVGKILESGFLDPVLSRSGFAGEKPGRVLMEDPGFSWLVDALGKRFISTGYVEHFGALGLPAVIVSSWVGGRWTLIGRLGLLDDAFPGFRVGFTDGKQRLWRGHFPDLPKGFQHVSFGIYEGIAFGVATREPAGVRYLMQVMQRQASSGSGLLMDTFADVVSVDLPDRMYFAPSFSPAFCVGLDFDEASRALALQTSIPIAETNIWGRNLPGVLSDVIPLIQPSASALLVGSAGNAMNVIDGLPLVPELKIVTALLFEHAAGRRDAAAFLAWVPKWNQGGRFMGVRVPSIGMALEVPENFEISDILQPLLRRLNERVDPTWGYVPYREQGVHALVSPSQHWYGKVSAGERVGVALWNGFLFVHSSAEALDIFLRETRANPYRDPVAVPLQTGSMFLADLPSSADVLDKGFSAYVLWQITQGKRRDRSLERIVKQVSDTMRAYDLLEITVQDLHSGRGQGGLRIVQNSDVGGR